MRKSKTSKKGVYMKTRITFIFLSIILGSNFGFTSDKNLFDVESHFLNQKKESWEGIFAFKKCIVVKSPIQEPLYFIIYEQPHWNVHKLDIVKQLRKDSYKIILEDISNNKKGSMPIFKEVIAKSKSDGSVEIVVNWVYPGQGMQKLKQKLLYAKNKLTLVGSFSRENGKWVPCYLDPYKTNLVSAIEITQTDQKLDQKKVLIDENKTKKTNSNPKVSKPPKQKPAIKKDSGSDRIFLVGIAILGLILFVFFRKNAKNKNN